MRDDALKSIPSSYIYIDRWDFLTPMGGSVQCPWCRRHFRQSPFSTDTWEPTAAILFIVGLDPLSLFLPLVILLFLFIIYKTSRLRDIVIGTGMTSLCSRPQTTVSHDASFLFHISLLLSWKFCNFFLFQSVDWLNRLFARLQRLAFAFESKLIVLFFFEKKKWGTFCFPSKPRPHTSVSSILLRWLLQLIA